MDKTPLWRRTFLLVLGIAFLASSYLVPGPAYSDDRQINSGPYSLTIRGGGRDDSASGGLDARVDLLNPLVNIHLFGTYEMLDNGGGLGAVSTQRYGGGFALSHTFPKLANVFAGTAVINEASEYFGHAYLGAKVMVTDFAFASASYGFHIGNRMHVPGPFTIAESVDWGKLGVVLVAQNGLKTNFYYSITDPGDRKISGIEGEISYPVTDATTVGVSGSSDLTRQGDVAQNWRGFAFIAYAFGGQKGNPIDVALDKNNPIMYPVVIRTTKAAAAAPAPGTPLSISPASTTNGGCFAAPTTFTASGGTGPYTWSTSDPYAFKDLKVINATQATWRDNTDAYCGVPATITVTVTDSIGATATATIAVSGGG